MSAKHSTRFFWSDWLGDPAVRRLTPAERGLWIDCLALMATANPTGYLCDDRGRPLTRDDMARLAGTSPTEAAKLLDGIHGKGVASVDRTGRLYNRRMVRDAEIAAQKRLYGKAGGAATRLKWQQLSALPQQNAWLKPQQRGSPSPIKDKNLSSEPRAGPASANPRAGPSRHGKAPAECTRDDLEAAFRRRASAAAPCQPDKKSGRP